MTGKRKTIHMLLLIILPLIVAWFGISMAGAIALVLATLVWRWAITLSGILVPAKVPALELETIAASHFVEKVRWCMDRLDLEYTERQMVAVLGVCFSGRSVPQLKIRTGNAINFTDITFASLSALWLQPLNFANGRADAVRIEHDRRTDTTKTVNDVEG